MVHSASFFFVVLTLAAVAWGDDPAQQPFRSIPQLNRGFTIDTALQIMEVVHERHVDPPVRQELALAFAQALHRQAGVAVPIGLGREFSALQTPQEIRARLLRYRREVGERLDHNKIQQALEIAVESRVPHGTFALTTLKEAGVAEQLASNRYVGIGIALSWDKQAETPVIANVLPGGAIDGAGIAAKTRIEAVDGTPTKGMNLAKVVQLLRGPRGSQVELLLKQPDDPEPTAVTITRDVVPILTVVDWSIENESPKIASLTISRIAASTAQELQEFDHKAREAHVEGLILDLTRTEAGNVHDTVLLAGALLEAGSIGKVLTADGERSFTADADALFAGLPLVVLIQRSTYGTTEWLAAALQDHGRAILVGQPTAGRGYAMSIVPVDGTEFAISIAGGVLQRADGRDLRADYPWAFGGGPMEEFYERSVPRRGPAGMPMVAGTVHPDDVVEGGGSLKSRVIKMLAELFEQRRALEDETPPASAPEGPES